MSERNSGRDRHGNKAGRGGAQRPAAPRTAQSRENRSRSQPYDAEAERRTRQGAAAQKQQARPGGSPPQRIRRGPQNGAAQPAQNTGARNAPRRPPQGAGPRNAPCRLPQDDHAPLYDQYQGGAPAQEPADPRVLRRKVDKRRRRLTQAEMRRRRFRRRLATGILIAAAAVGGLALTVLLLFKITTFEVQAIDGTSPADTGSYTSDEIVAALGLSKGDNLFSFRAKDEKALLDAKFPLLENIRVLRRLPGTVIVRVEPAKETYCLHADAGWVTLSAGMKVISVGEDQPALPQIKGLAVDTPQVGAALAIKDPGQAKLLQNLLSALDSAQMLSHMTYLSLGDTEEISFIYDDRVRVSLGTANSLSYKLRLAGYILFNTKGDGLSETDRGMLIVSDLLTDGTIEPRFSQGDPHAGDAADDEAAAAAAAAIAAGSGITVESDAAASSSAVEVISSGAGASSAVQSEASASASAQPAAPAA